MSALPDDLYTDVPEAFQELFGDLDNDNSDTAWMRSGLCGQAMPDAWFPEKGENTREAKKICFRCPVRAQCEEWVMGRLERGINEYGLWAGLSREQREDRFKKGKEGASLRSTRNAQLDAEIAAMRRARVPLEVVASQLGVSPRTVERAVVRDRQAA